MPKYERVELNALLGKEIYKIEIKAAELEEVRVFTKCGEVYILRRNPKRREVVGFDFFSDGEIVDSYCFSAGKIFDCFSTGKVFDDRIKNVEFLARVTGCEDVWLQYRIETENGFRVFEWRVNHQDYYPTDIEAVKINCFEERESGKKKN